jgi:hypothetical protein
MDFTFKSVRLVIGFNVFADKFLANNITGWRALQMSIEDFVRLGISDENARRVYIAIHNELEPKQ